MMSRPFSSSAPRRGAASASGFDRAMEEAVDRYLDGTAANWLAKVSTVISCILKQAGNVIPTTALKVIGQVAGQTKFTEAGYIRHHYARITAEQTLISNREKGKTELIATLKKDRNFLAIKLGIELAYKRGLDLGSQKKDVDALSALDEREAKRAETLKRKREKEDNEAMARKAIGEEIMRDARLGLLAPPSKRARHSLQQPQHYVDDEAVEVDDEELEQEEAEADAACLVEEDEEGDEDMPQSHGDYEGHGSYEDEGDDDEDNNEDDYEDRRAPVTHEDLYGPNEEAPRPRRRLVRPIPEEPRADNLDQDDGAAEAAMAQIKAEASASAFTAEEDAALSALLTRAFASE